MAASDVDEAFEILLTCLGSAVAGADEDVTLALRRRDHEGAQTLLARAKAVGTLRENVLATHTAWKELIGDATSVPVAHPHGAPPPVGPTSGRRGEGDAGGTGGGRPPAEPRTPRRRLPRAVGTPEDEYRIPILRALAELGGEATASEVLARVHELMMKNLRPVDLEVLGPPLNTPRWRNTAVRVRGDLVNDGLMRGDSPRGTWAISAAGVQSLEGVPSIGTAEDGAGELVADTDPEKTMNDYLRDWHA